MRSPLEFRFEPKAHKYFLGSIELPGITWVLKDNGFLTEHSYDPDSLRRGKLVHLLCQYLDENDLDWGQVPDELMGYVIAWERFIKQTGFRPLAIEKPRYHPLFMFAGTPDRDGIFPDGTKALIEIKTGKVTAAAALQMAAQELLIGEPRRRMAIELSPNGLWKPSAFHNHQDKNMFLSALSISNWRIKHGLTSKEKHHEQPRIRDGQDGNLNTRDGSEAFGKFDPGPRHVLESRTILTQH